MLVQFHVAISYAAGKVGIECFEPIPMASCAGNHESKDVFVRNFQTAEF